MEKYSKTLKTRVMAMRIYCGVVAIFLLLGTVFHLTDYETRGLSFIIGACVGIMLVILFQMAKYTKALRDPEEIRRLYIEETDERHKLILDKTGGNAINLVIMGLLLATIAAAFLNETVFLTLLGTTFFTSFVKAGLKLFYLKRI